MLNQLTPRSLLIASLLPVIALTGCKSEQKPAGNPMDMPVPVEVTQVRVGPLSQGINAVGSLSSPQQTAIAPQIGGKIVALNIEQGQPVHAGTVLAQLDDATLRAQLLSAEASLSNAQQVYARDQQIAGSGALSAQQITSDATAVKVAEASLAQIRANLDYTKIRAPFAGTLGIRQVSLGSYVAPGTTLVTLQSLNPLYLDFSLPQNQYSQVKNGQAVHFKVDGLQGDFTGKVTATNPALSGDSRSIAIRATVANNDERLKPGMFANIQLQTGTVANVVFIPQQAIVAEGNARKVWVVDNQKNATLRDIKLGQFETNWVQVTSGLVAGDSIIATGLQKMHPKAKLVIKPYQPIHNPRLDLANPADNGAGA